VSDEKGGKQSDPGENDHGGIKGKQSSASPITGERHVARGIIAQPTAQRAANTGGSGFA